MHEQFGRLFQYEEWADREELTQLRSAPNDAAQRILGHIVAGQRLWMDRLLAKPQSMPVWPELSLDQMDAELQALAPAWQEYLREARFAHSTAEYTNTKGETYTSRVDDVLTHLLLHGAYHRGQIATILRGAGHEPAYTDYIHCVRQGFV